MKMIEIDFKKETLTSVKNAGLLNIKKNGSLTRPCAAICSAIELTQEGKDASAVALDEHCFDVTGFTLSGNKSKGTSKNSGGTGKLYTRLNDYLNRDRSLFTYDRYKDQITFTEKGKALFLKQKRVKINFSRVDREKAPQVKFKSRKAIITKADYKKISKQLVSHIK